MSDLDLLDTIKKINPWFKTKRVSENQLQKFKRREYPRLIKNLSNLSTADLIIGGRRVGKSVLMYQFIDFLLKKGVDPKKILFIQGDNTILQESLGNEQTIKKLLNIYERHILEQEFDELKDTVYIFIDEAHQLSKWQAEVKILIDLKYNLKFIITGSSSFELRKGPQNPLAGRVNIEIIPPFSFADFVRFDIHGKEREEFGEKINTLSARFQKYLFEGNISGLKKTANNSTDLINRFQIKNRFKKYLFIGGFPQLVSNPSEDMNKYLKDLLTTTVAKDILSQVQIRENQAFERLIVNLCINVGQKTNYKSLARKLGVDERSLSRYIDYYADSHWVSVSSPFEFHRKQESVKSEKKVYIIDNGVINVLAFKDEKDLEKDTDYKGCIIENIIHNHLLSLKQAYSGGMFQNFLPFWSNPEGKEIDFIFEIKGGNIPIESKAKRLLTGNDLAGLKNFIKKYRSAEFGIITTEEELKIKDNILFIPYIILILLL